MVQGEGQFETSSIDILFDIYFVVFLFTNTLTRQ